jgi:Tol biopolymer transport system component
MRNIRYIILLAPVTIVSLVCGEPESQTGESEPPTEESPAVAVVGPGVISTERNETFPAEDPLDGSLWFSRYDDSFDAQTIMFARWTESGWAAPEVAPFSGQWGDRAPRFSPDGSTLYFTSNRPREPGGSAADMNIWRVPRAGGSWGEPELMESPLNSDANDIHASATNEAIWVASNRDGGLGRSDIYRVAEDGGLEHLTAPINDENSQPDLWVSHDESWMILVITDRPGGYGGDDLYLTRFNGEFWSAPTNLGPEINSAEYEYGPTVSADGEYLYLTSHRGGSADVYRVGLSSVVNGGR